MPSYVKVNKDADEKSITIENLCIECLKKEPKCKQVSYSRMPFYFFYTDPARVDIYISGYSVSRPIKKRIFKILQLNLFLI